MRPASEIWEASLGELQVQVSKPNFETWLKDTRGVSQTDGVFVVGVPSVFVGEWLNSRLRSLILKTLAGITGQTTDVRFAVYTQERPAVPVPAAQPDGGVSTRLRPPVSAPRVNPRYTFDSFIPGDSNRGAYQASLDIIDAEAPHSNPLFIHGLTGLGKTHLLQAMAHAAHSRGLRTAYMTAAQFTDEFVAAIKARKIEDFRGRFRDLQVFLLDDVQFLSDREQTQETLLQIFIELYNNNCWIALAADRPPREIRGLDSRLQSRFSWGLVTGIVRPDRDTCLAILQAKAIQMVINVSPDCLGLIADGFTGNIRELEGLLHQVRSRSRSAGAGPDGKLIADILGEHAPHTIGFCEAARLIPAPAVETAGAAPTPEQLTPGQIVETVAGYFKLSGKALTGPSRDKLSTRARHIAMYLMSQEFHYATNEIGRIFGNRDHSTVLYGCRRIKASLASDADLKRRVAELTQEIRSLHPPGPAVE